MLLGFGQLRTCSYRNRSRRSYDHLIERVCALALDSDLNLSVHRANDLFDRTPKLAIDLFCLKDFRETLNNSGISARDISEELRLRARAACGVHSCNACPDKRCC